MEEKKLKEELEKLGLQIINDPGNELSRVKTFMFSLFDSNNNILASLPFNAPDKNAAKIMFDKFIEHNKSMAFVVKKVEMGICVAVKKIDEFVPEEVSFSDMLESLSRNILKAAGKPEFDEMMAEFFGKDRKEVVTARKVSLGELKEIIDDIESDEGEWAAKVEVFGPEEEDKLKIH